MKYIGVNIGALTVKLSALNGAEARSIVVPHQGRPAAVLKELLAEVDFAAADYFGVSGHLGHISEAAAIQRALREAKSDFDAVVFSSSRSAGWDWAWRRPSNVHSPAKSCRWPRAARCTANRTSPISSTAMRRPPRTSSTRCTT